MPVEIYTDGSCHTQLKLGAWASIVLIADEKIVLKGETSNTTNNRMEMTAVIQSIRFCDQNQLNGQLLLYTDSQYVCRIPERKEKLKQNQFLTSKGTLIQNADLVQILIQQIESHTIRFIKVEAHRKTGTDSSKYNNQADMLSRNLVRENARREVTKKTR